MIVRVEPPPGDFGDDDGEQDGYSVNEAEPDHRLEVTKGRQRKVFQHVGGPETIKAFGEHAVDAANNENGDEHRPSPYHLRTIAHGLDHGLPGGTVFGWS